MTAPHSEPGQVIYLPPGTRGSLIIARDAEAGGTTEGIAIPETGTLPWRGCKHEARLHPACRLPRPYPAMASVQK
ncbi:hypothetical protein RM543_17230 [Roseicyclus sp. F158]|uniref:Uncharacterized protein n=1 Tax=Tropicimonas omnivorans TaxID=3075590 RepID=A0ABU3DL35_9RHOB|nr:hypothetical protein [Roseicyclus sp. F158]MDT0684427.1 hypothetical protein [Roseicyclus sp. F158]